MNGEAGLSSFDVTDILKVFDLKSSDEHGFPLYHYIFKTVLKSLATETTSSEDLSLFSDEECGLFRICLRENIDEAF